MFTVLIFIAVLALLVLSHEWGHFIVARQVGIKVDEFGFGFPPRIVGIHKAADGNWHVVWGNRKIQQELQESEHAPGTLYSVNLIPLGGFVKIKGEDAAEAGATDPDSFTVKKFWQKVSVLVAGVVMNFFLAAILLSVGFMIGLPATVDSIRPGTRLVNAHTEVIQVLKDSPAATADIKVGDVIARIGIIDNPTVEQMQKFVQEHSQEEILVVIEREEEVIAKKIKPAVIEETKKAALGVALTEVGILRFSPFRAMYEGFVSAFIYTKEIFVAFAILIKGLFQGAGAGADIAGPVGVAKLAGQAARLGIGYLIQFTALLSLNLAVLNILPIPALDGGRLLFVVIGKLFGRPVSPRTEYVIHAIGFILLMMLVIAVTVGELGLVGFIKTFSL